MIMMIFAQDSFGFFKNEMVLEMKKKVESNSKNNMTFQLWFESCENIDYNHVLIF